MEAELAAAADAAAAQYDEFERDGDDAFADHIHGGGAGGPPFVPPPPPPPQAVATPQPQDNGYAPSNGYDQGQGQGDGYGNGYHSSMHAGSAIPVAGRCRLNR